MVFGLKGQGSMLGLGLTAIRRGFELYECLLVPIISVIVIVNSITKALYCLIVLVIVTSEHGGTLKLYNDCAV